MREPPPLFRYRPQNQQILLGGVVPLVFGVVVGLVLGVSATDYWILAGIAGLGAILAGFEHPDGWGGADRGVVGGGIYALGLLLAHYISGAHAKVSLGSFPPFLIIVSAIVGMFLGALGGSIGRRIWTREAPSEESAATPGDSVAPQEESVITPSEQIEI
ncbi:MAG TPA: hypothetical protein VMB91_06685 [Solirubrobacteraceae bacterium]|nr:hypothetical protein [Solirubrobacteraceae bacterium]